MIMGHIRQVVIGLGSLFFVEQLIAGRLRHVIVHGL